MVIAVCWQVITRYILNNPSTVTEEALRYLLIWVTMVGGAYAYGRRKHLAITALSKRLSFKGQKILDIFVQAMVILFCVVVMIGGGTRLVHTAADQLSAALQLPMPLIYASVPVGAILFMVGPPGSRASWCGPAPRCTLWKRAPAPAAARSG